ncbi:MAG: hypothetical protein HY245_08720 [Rhizobiales bacterium]|nr:hypothetical protein [Hyphomicrobiales bacterium]MBI3673486.1 hypothetical protein [Hyphomicrobiales bacterium]
MKLSKRIDLLLLQYLRVLRLALCSARYHHRMEIDRLPPATGIARDDIIVFTAADSEYLGRFLLPFAGSMVVHIPGPRLHIHLYNPQNGDFNLIKSIQEKYSSLQLTLSHEYFASRDFERRARASSKQTWKSLYICSSRFLAARTIQRLSGATLLITDIDILFNGNIKDRFGGGIECALLLRPNEKNLCKRTLGGVVFASANPVGQQFLATACDYIERFLRAGFYWFAFDQFALYRAVRAMSEDERRNSFSALTSRDVSFELAKDGLILFPKGKLKDEEAFANLARTYEGRDKDS